MNTSSKEELPVTYRPTAQSTRFYLLALLTVVASFTILLSGQAQQAVATGGSVVVTISGPPGQVVFSPALLTIHIYDTVIFVNQSTTPYAVAADDTSFSSPAIPHNQQWSTTFSVLGAHSYHATSTTSSTTTAVGEILVVADSVALLSTPQPQIEATALAIIRAGKHPPDVIQLPTTTTPVISHRSQTNLQARLLSMPVLAITGGVLAFFILLVILLITRSRRKRSTIHDEDEWIENEFFDRYNTNIHQKYGSSTASATLVAQEVQQTTQATQTPKRTWYTRPFQAIHAIQVHIHNTKGDKNNEDSEYEEYEE